VHTLVIIHELPYIFGDLICIWAFTQDDNYNENMFKVLEMCKTGINKGEKNSGLPY